MKLDTREKEGSKNILISINPNSYVSLSLLSSIFIFFFLSSKIWIFFINELRFWLNFFFQLFQLLNSFMCNINICVFFYEKKIIYVFLKANAQYNYKHYFKLGCYIYLLVS